MIRASSQPIYRQKPIIKRVYPENDTTVHYEKFYRLQRRRTLLFYSFWTDYQSIDIQYVEGQPEELDEYVAHLLNYIYLSK